MTAVLTSPRGMGRARLFLVLAGLYIAQSIPAYLFVAAFPPILREHGVSRTAIGFMSVLLLPLVLKFLWAPLVDRVRPFARAHRAGWVILTQLGIVSLIFSLLLVGPTDMTAILGIGFVTSVLLSTQDIATDGYAAKYLDERDRPIGNAIQGGAIAFGVVVGGTASLAIYHHFGWQAMILTAAIGSLVPLVAAFAMREEDAAGPGGVSRASVLAFLRRPETFQILLIALIYRSSEGLVKAMEGAYLVDRGVPLDVIGYLSGGAAATAGLAGSAIAAVLLMRIGTVSVLALLGVLRTVCFALFAAHAIGLATGYAPLFGAAAFQTLIRYMEIVALYSLYMSVASKEQPGTDFTILACAQLIVYFVGSTASGILADRLGYGALFSLATLLSALSVLITTWMLARRERPDAWPRSS